MMKLKPITKAQNQKRIMMYYSLAIIFASLGLVIRNTTFYVIAVAFLGLALIRKYWLNKQLGK